MAEKMGLGLKIVVGILVLMFLLQGVTKIFGILLVEEFAQWGYSRAFHFIIGVVEVGAALALLKSSTRTQGALAIVAVMLGAIFTLVRAGTPDMTPPAIVMLILAAFVAMKSRGPAV